MAENHPENEDSLVSLIPKCITVLQKFQVEKLQCVSDDSIITSSTVESHHPKNEASLRAVITNLMVQFENLQSPNKAESHNPEAYLEAVIPKRIRLFEEIQAKQLEKLQSMPHDPITITFQDGSVKEGKRWETTPMDIAADISRGLANWALISSVNNELWDMNRPLERFLSYKQLKLYDSTNAFYLII